MVAVSLLDATPIPVLVLVSVFGYRLPLLKHVRIDRYYSLAFCPLNLMQSSLFSNSRILKGPVPGFIGNIVLAMLENSSPKIVDNLNFAIWKKVFSNFACPKLLNRER